MARYAMIRDSKVENVCLWDGSVATWQPPANVLMVECDETVGVDDTYENGTFTRHVQALPVPSEIGLAQFRIILRRSLGVSRTNLDTMILGLIMSFPSQLERDDALDLWESASVVRRDHSFVESGRIALGLSIEQVDQMFREGSTI